MINLKKITFDNFDECNKLETKENQKNFVASNLISLAQAYVALSNGDGIPMPYAIYRDDVMIGFIMLSYTEANEIHNENAYWVWRFMIDKVHQGKGYGKASMNKAIELVKTFPYGHASEIYLSYEPENIKAKKLYSSMGFIETGDIEDGELVAKLLID
ncbi:GNAT family N-acetyltransferase [Clostridium sp. UBA1652]|uniref:GNAT family N-acetyltransferase n=1 Tax=Clostridium sp. UBA1652 TaxID=1946348 RepID=UPI00258091C0|nr:GNAT family N-acetyltransferase [Clostridium sp. UBA1652]